MKEVLEELIELYGINTVLMSVVEICADNSLEGEERNWRRMGMAIAEAIAIAERFELS